ncbi:MAG: S-layer homology domain-containing protein [Phormidesmis sp. RL_2_1]|nr:S-layer homology domain-containing protein [Phormidesmis sp. RL_2_1]
MFSDIANHWANECIMALAQRGFISGYPNGTFRPKALVSRAEFAALLPKVFDQLTERQAAGSFADVPMQHWAHGAVTWASQRGLLSGYEDGSFRPRQTMSRVQAVVVVVAGLDAAQGVAAEVSQTDLTTTYFSDAAQIPDYAKEAVSAALDRQLLERLGEPRPMQPNQAITRGEVAALLCRALAIPAAELTGEYPALAADQTAIFQQFLQQEEGFDAAKLAFLDRGIQTSPYRDQIAQYAVRLQELPALSAPLKQTAAYPKTGEIFFVNEMGLEFLPPDLLAGCVCLSTLQGGIRQTRWLGRDALSDRQLWSATKFIPLLAVAARANAIAPTVSIDRYRIRPTGSSAQGYTFYELAAGITSYDNRIATSNSLAVMFKNFETPESLEKWTQQITGNQALSFQGRYGEVPFIEFPELWNPQTQKVVLKAKGKRHSGENLVSPYDLTRLMTMAAWHWQVPHDAKIPEIQGHSLATIIRALGVDTARYIDVAIETLGLSDAIDAPVIISKSGFGRSDQRDRTELTYCAFVQFSLPRKITVPGATDPTASHQQYSLAFTLVAAQDVNDANQEARYIDALMATAVTEIIRRAVLGTL